MAIFSIKNNTDYQATLAEIDKLMDSEINTPEGDTLDILVTLVENYEAETLNLSLKSNPVKKRPLGLLKGKVGFSIEDNFKITDEELLK